MRIDTSKLRYLSPRNLPGAADDLAASAHYATDTRRAQFLAGRDLVRRLLAAETRSSAQAWRILEDGNGRPYAVGDQGRGPDISISHSGPFVAAALTNIGRIGIDVERAGRRTTSHLKLAQAYFAANEVAAVERGGESVFLRIWTLREAIGKATGRGLSDALGFAGDLIGSGEWSTAIVAWGERHWVLGTRDLGGGTLSCAVELGDGDPEIVAREMQSALDRLPRGAVVA